MMYANILTQRGPVNVLPGGLYGSVDYHGSPPWTVAVAHGWRKLDSEPTTPAGQYVTGRGFAQDLSRPEHCLAAYSFAEIPVPYPQPDITVPMLDASGEQVGTARIIVDSVTLAPVIVVNSASPQKPWPSQKTAFLANLAADKAERAAIKAMCDALSKDSKVDKATKDAASAAVAAANAPKDKGNK